MKQIQKLVFGLFEYVEASFVFMPFRVECCFRLLYFDSNFSIVILTSGGVCLRQWMTTAPAAHLSLWRSTGKCKEATYSSRTLSASESAWNLHWKCRLQNKRYTHVFVMRAKFGSKAKTIRSADVREINDQFTSNGLSVDCPQTGPLNLDRHRPYYRIIVEVGEKLGAL